MQQLLRELRAVIEHEYRLYGAFMLLEGRIEAREPATRAIAAEDAGHAVDERATPPRGDARTPAGDASVTPPVRSETSSPSNDTDERDASPMASHDLFGNEIDPTEDVSLLPWDRIAALIPGDSPLQEMSTLEEVEAYVASTTLIPIDRERINPVFGVGDPQADLMVIGEAPGADEDRQGEPFVGRAGQLLNKILAAIGFEREHVYIANILKTRPPNNRDPLEDEVAAHIPILYKQIALIRPKLLLCVGRTAGKSLLNRNGSLSSMRQKFHDFYGLPVLVTYHPAALLRNPNWKRPTWEDVQLARSKYDELVG